MRLFGWEVMVRKAGIPQAVTENRGGWWPLIREPFSGAWQRNVSWTAGSVMAYHAVYACVTLIANDIGKLRPKLVEKDANGIWSETTSAAFSPVLRRPNHYQNYMQFKRWWFFCKLSRGNAYALKERDGRGVVRALYVLDPSRVQVLVAPDGGVFYDLQQDNLGAVPAAVQVPASEIIHDHMNEIFHPLVGTSPIFACGAQTQVGLEIIENSTKLFSNGATPSGILTAPGVIRQAEADEMSARWKANYSGANAGKVAVLGSGLKFERLSMTAVDAQLIEQLKYTSEIVCGVFHVPPFKIGAGTMPAYSNGEILDQRYYSDCLQSHIEDYEVLMDDGLGIGEGQPKEGKTLGVELDLDGLLRMDSATLVDTLVKGVGGAIYSPDEARARLDLKPVKGGASPMAQQQNYSLAALAERDADKPFAKPTPAVSAVTQGDEDVDKDEAEDEEKSFDYVLDGLDLRIRELEMVNA